MNNKTRKQIDNLISRLREIENYTSCISDDSDRDEVISELEEYRDALGDMADEIQEMADEEQEKYDNMPESLQDSDRAYQYQDATDALQSAADSIDTMCFDDIISSLEDEDENLDFSIDFTEVIDYLETARDV